jgi:hypothetical protein
VSTEDAGEWHPRRLKHKLNSESIFLITGCKFLHYFVILSEAKDSRCYVADYSIVSPLPWERGRGEGYQHLDIRPQSHTNFPIHGLLTH